MTYNLTGRNQSPLPATRTSPVIPVTTGQGSRAGTQRFAGGYSAASLPGVTRQVSIPNMQTTQSLPRDVLPAGVVDVNSEGIIQPVPVPYSHQTHSALKLPRTSGAESSTDPVGRVSDKKCVSKEALDRIVQYCDALRNERNLAGSIFATLDSRTENDSSLTDPTEAPEERPTAIAESNDAVTFADRVSKSRSRKTQ